MQRGEAPAEGEGAQGLIWDWPLIQPEPLTLGLCPQPLRPPQRDTHLQCGAAREWQVREKGKVSLGVRSQNITSRPEAGQDSPDDLWGKRGSPTSQSFRVLARTNPFLAQERGLTLPVLIWSFLSSRQMRSTLACLPACLHLLMKPSSLHLWSVWGWDEQVFTCGLLTPLPQVGLESLVYTQCSSTLH